MINKLDRHNERRLASDIKANARNLQELKSRQSVSTQYAVTADSEISIQQAIDIVDELGGGTVFLRNGTYNLSSNITVPSNVTIQGETGEGVNIDFGNQAYQVIVEGSVVSTTGTCSINNRSTTVTGVGTSWTVGLIGQSILLKGRWFVITAVGSTTSLTIESLFDADNVAAQAVVIADPVRGVSLNDFTVLNSTHANGAVYFHYTILCDLDDVTALDSAIGLNFVACNIQTSQNFYTGGCGTGTKVANSAVWTMYNFENYGSTGVNLLCDNFYNTSVANATISSATGNNVTMTNCSGWGFYDMENTTAGGKGIELISCTDIEIFAMSIRQATSDGIKLTSGCSRIGIINNVSLINNGGYGVNIAAASDDKNTILGCFFSGNTSGTVNNAGTNTINANNQT